MLYSKTEFKAPLYVISAETLPDYLYISIIYADAVIWVEKKMWRSRLFTVLLKIIAFD